VQQNIQKRLGSSADLDVAGLSSTTDPRTAQHVVPDPIALSGLTFSPRLSNLCVSLSSGGITGSYLDVFGPHVSDDITFDQVVE
jgi:hypothetical protein